MAIESPREQGYRWPAEWELHAATWLAWPHKSATWPGRLQDATTEFVEFAKTLARYEQVHLLAGGHLEAAKRLLGAVRNIELWDIPTNDAWVRDYGPTFVKRKEQTLVVDYRYNAWGNKYPPFDKDDNVAKVIARQLDLPIISSAMILEGGSIEGNGRSVLMTTKNCLLHPNRNPDMSLAEIEDNLREHLGCDEILWLEGELAGDDTDSHIDQLARFLGPTTVAVATEVDRAEENFTSLSCLREQLAGTHIHQQRVSLVDLPMPRPIIQGGQRLPASYVNFYFANEVVIMPQFHDAADERAMKIIEEQLPNREVIGVSCRELVLGLGGFHCLTQQQPY